MNGRSDLKPARFEKGGPPPDTDKRLASARQRLHQKLNVVETRLTETFSLKSLVNHSPLLVLGSAAALGFVAALVVAALADSPRPSTPTKE